MALAPFVFLVLAFVSRHPRAPGAVLRGMGWSLVVGVTVFVLARDVVTAVVAAYGAGGVVSLRAEPVHAGWGRPVAVLVATVYTSLLLRTATPMGLFGAPFFPLVALGVADFITERRRRT